MKISKSQLRRIIQEELKRVSRRRINENVEDFPFETSGPEWDEPGATTSAEGQIAARMLGKSSYMELVGASDDDVSGVVEEFVPIGEKVYAVDSEDADVTLQLGDLRCGKFGDYRAVAIKEVGYTYANYLL